VANQVPVGPRVVPVLLVVLDLWASKESVVLKALKELLVTRV